MESVTERARVHRIDEGPDAQASRYVLPDLAPALARGSAHLGLPAPRDLDGALGMLLAAYRSGPAPVDLGDLDALLGPFLAGMTDAAVHDRLGAFWEVLGREFPGAEPHAGLGPDDGRAVRAVLRVDRERRRAVPGLTLRVDPVRTPDDLLREAVLTACADGKPRFVDHRALVAVLGERYGVAGCHAAFPRGGGAHAVVVLDVAAGVRRHEGPGYPGAALAADVDAAVDALVERVRAVAPGIAGDWRVREGLLDPARFTAAVAVHGVAEAAELLVARRAPVADGGSPARYGRDPAVAEAARELLHRVAALVAGRPVPHCPATGGRALLQASSAAPDGPDGGATPGARVPPGREPGLYDHLRLVIPQHRCLTGGGGDVLRFEAVVEQNPEAVVAVLRGAFSEGARDVAFDVTGNGFTRVTGFLVPTRDVAALRAAAAAKVAAIQAARR